MRASRRMPTASPTTPRWSRSCRTPWRGQPSAHWLEAFGAAGIPSEPVLSYDEALAHPQGQARGLVTEFEDAERGPLPHLAPPVRLEGTPATIRRRAPDLGEHDAEIRAWLAAQES